MFDLIHEMRTRVMKSKEFTSEKIVGVILFEQTMNRKIDDMYTSDYLWSKNILSFLKVDKGLKDIDNGVQLMNSFAPDTIIALGGGSAIDAAKGMWLFYEHPE